MENIGEELYKFAYKIFPYTRSITGEGFRLTLRDIKDWVEEGTDVSLDIHEVPSGTQIFDWTVPKEWSIRECYIENESGKHIIDMKDTNLHVMGYSVPVDKWVELDELLKYVYTEQNQPDVIPYVTSYYKERFGFCMSENLKNSLKPGKYHMYIDSDLKNGNLTYGEIVIPGESEKEVFFSTYLCHPSMANNECSGPALSAALVRFVAQMKKRKYTYRFVYIPETIGSITYLSQNNHLEQMQKNMIAGFNLSCVGDNYDYSIVESKYADTLADKVLKNALKYKCGDNGFSTYTFKHRGSDERQYNSAGVDLPVVCFCRSKFGEFPEYHTSADNMSYVSPEGFAGSYEVMCNVINALEYNAYYKMKVLCEPQLGKRGLYPTISKKGSYDKVKAMVDFIAYADGKNDLIDISNFVDFPVSELTEPVDKLLEAGLLERRY